MLSLPQAFVAAAPGRFTFEGGALLTSVLGLLVKPWRLIANTSNFFNWLVSGGGEERA